MSYETNGPPIVTLSLDRMKMQIHHAFLNAQLQEAAEINRALERVLTPQYVIEVLEKQVRAELDEAIKYEVHAAFRYGAGGRKIVKEAVLEKLAEFFAEEEKP